METNNKLREAVVKCCEIALQWQADEAAGVAGTTDKPHARSAAEAVIDMEFELNAALSAPPRNCDVGTASEQEDRFAKYCRGSNYCAVCPIRKSWDFKNGRRPSCAILWAQMPYEEGGDISGNKDRKVHAAVSIMGRESPNAQCYECANCAEPTDGWDASKFRCAFLGKDFGTWHYDVPNECPCKGKGWMPKKKEGGAK